MPSALNLSIDAAWLSVGVVWAFAATSLKPVARIEPQRSRIGHLITISIALTLLFSPALHWGPLASRIVPASPYSATAGLALTIAGAAFATWARFYLGGNWSATVTVKQDHTLIRTGPYALVRHPIYLGLLIAMLGTAIAFGHVAGLFAVAIAFAAWLAKARVEECLLLLQFGDDYKRYQRQVKTMIPFVL